MGIVVLVAAVAGLLFAGYLALSVLKYEEGGKRMQEIATAIRQGAMAFLKREFKTLLLFTLAMSAILAVVVQPTSGLAYFLGTSASSLAAYLGMNIATRANVRTANAAARSYATALKIAFRSGAVMGFSVVGLGLFGVALLYLAFQDPKVWLSYAFGASAVALFLRVGGGIFTKSADVGADLVGKVEAGIPEDDPRNPAVIAAKGVLVSLLLGAAGIVCSIVGTLFVRPPEVHGSFEEQASRARATMNRGVYVSNVLTVIASYVIVRQVLGEMGVFWAMMAGLLSGFLIGMATEYFTSERAPVIGIAKASQTGAAINVMEGLSVGMMSTAVPILLVAVATVLAHRFASPHGLFGIAVASMGMLVTLGIVLSIDCYGPIADNAAGIAEMAGLGREVRERTEALDAVGNTTAAIGKGFAISSAALAALAWLATYFEVAKIQVIDLTDVHVIAGLFIGSMLPFVFCALAMRAVSGGAFEVVSEVRRQFKEIQGLMEGRAKPDSIRCVDIATRWALRAMLPPGIIVIATPIAVGVTLGLEALGGVLAGSLLSGFLLAITMANSGGAWDNAKKYIEAGHFGGKGSDAHKAAVIGDTVGDPFKDTAGPSLNILIKVVGKVAVIFVPLFLMVL